MIKRMIFRGQYKKGEKNNIVEYLNNYNSFVEKNILTISVFSYERNLFVYYECIEKEIAPEDLLISLEKYLEAWPGEETLRYWVPMCDIFHYNYPVSLEHWKRKTNTQASAVVSRMKPETLARYIYYHYQYQEERPGDGNKYGIIGLHENLVFLYLEKPEVIEKTLYEGALKTKNTPPNWANVMAPHFIPWSDVPELMREIELIFQFCDL